MVVFEGISLLLDLGMILLAATFFNYIARILKQPALLAYIVAGIVIGPYALGSLGLEFAGVPLGVTTTEEIMILSELGVAFLLFSIGVESNFSKLAELGKVVTIGSVLQVSLTALLVFSFNFVLNVLSFEQSLYLGLILAFSSTTIVVKLLSDNHEINSLHGRLMIGFLLVQDVLVIIALPLLENIANIFSLSLILPLILKILVFLVFAYLLNRYVYPKLFAFAVQSDELFFLSAMSSVFLFIFLSFLLNFSIAVGAFVAGVALSTLPYNLEVLHKIRGVRDFLATIFFVTLGIQIAPTFTSFPLEIALVIIGIVFVFKPLLYYIITLFSGYGSRVSLMVALGLAQISEFSFIIANQGRPILEATPGLYPFLIIIIATSMAVTPYFMGYSNFFYDLTEKLFGKFLAPLKKSEKFNKKINDLEKVPENLTNHIVIFGGGLVGSGIATILGKDNELVVIDNDSEIVWGNMKAGINSGYGSADNEEIWKKVNLEKAKVLILAIPRAKEGLALVKYARKVNPELAIFGRARFFAGALALYNAGADFVIMPHVIGSNLFVEKVATFLNNNDINEIRNYNHEYLHYLKGKAKEERTSFE